MKLRDYQQAAVEAVLENWKTHRKCLIVLPTGCGKTVVFGEVIRRRLDDRRRRKKSPLAGPSLRLIREGLKDSRLSVVCERMHLSWSRLQTVTAFLQARLGPCFQALRAWRKSR